MFEDGSYYPETETFSRQQVQARTGVPDDVLAFWIKQELLLPIPAERRAHRRFSFEQLHIAMLLNAMRSLGANVNVLRKFSNVFQNGFRVWKKLELTPSQVRAAYELNSKINDFRAGQSVRVRQFAEDYGQSGIATSEEEIIKNWFLDELLEGATENLAEIALSTSKFDMWCVDWAKSLVSYDHLINRTEAWLAWIDNDERARLSYSDSMFLETDAGPLSAFYIPIQRLIARIWSDRLDEVQNRIAAERLEWRKQQIAAEELTDPAEARRLRRMYSIPEDGSGDGEPSQEGGEMSP